MSDKKEEYLFNIIMRADEYTTDVICSLLNRLNYDSENGISEKLIINTDELDLPLLDPKIQFIDIIPIRDETLSDGSREVEW